DPKAFENPALPVRRCAAVTAHRRHDERLGSMFPGPRHDFADDDRQVCDAAAADGNCDTRAGGNGEGNEFGAHGARNVPDFLRVEPLPYPVKVHPSGTKSRLRWVNRQTFWYPQARASATA